MGTGTRVPLLPLSLLLAAPSLVSAQIRTAPMLRSALPVPGLPMPLVSLAPSLSRPLLPSFLAAPALPAGANAALPKPVVPVVAAPASVPAALPAPEALPASAPEAAKTLSDQVRSGLPPDALFDGSRAERSSVRPEPAAAPKLYSWFRIADPAHAAALAAILEAAEESATGRATLSKLKAKLRSRKRPLVFEFTKQVNSHAYVDWETDVVRLGTSMLKEDPAHAAPVLIHELTHVIQKSRRLPYHAFELELEAFLVTLKSARELGVTYKRGDFMRATQLKFKGDLDEFIDWLHAGHDQKENFRLLSGSRDEFLRKLEERLDAEAKKVATAARTVARRQATYEQMKAASYLPSALENYRNQELEPAREKLRSAQGSYGLVERDLRLLRSVNGYLRYRHFADDVRAMAKRLHDSWN
ncbi:hypothetical protein EPO15_18245 [bacterium]|nr:MAG: hypothetical protein EPO15_18245 [bacterium]